MWIIESMGQFYGPFTTEDGAVNWASHNLYGTWRVARLESALAATK